MSSRKIISAWFAGVAFLAGISFVDAQVVNPGIQQSGSVTAGHCTKWGPGLGQVSDAGAACASQSSSANPTATAGPTAINGSAVTFMRSDAAPAVQQGSAAQKGIVQVDGTTITATGGVISAAASANPSATAGPAAINGSAVTFMRSDAAPAVQLGTNAVKGLIQGDGSSISCVAGVCSAASSANPTATAGPTAINGSAATFMRSDAAPAVQQGSATQKGIVQVDGTTITATGGVISAIAGTFPTPTRTGDVIYWNGSAWVSLPGNNSGTGILAENASGTPSWFSPATMQATLGSYSTANTTGLMAGYGATCAITPTLTGRVNISFYATMASTTAGGGIIAQLRYGSGTAPSANAVLTGTPVGNGVTINENTANNLVFGSLGAIVTGLTPNTTYWIDLSLRAGGGTVSFSTASCTANEF